MGTPHQLCRDQFLALPPRDPLLRCPRSRNVPAAFGSVAVERRAGEQHEGHRSGHVMKTPTSISCTTGREPSTEKQTIDASTMAPAQLVPRVGACTRSKKLPNRSSPTAPTR